MIYLITDFGTEGPYLGQMQAVLIQTAPHIPVINLLSDAPPCDPLRTAYLVAAYTSHVSPGDVVLGVVDPGVGSNRAGIVLVADDIWYVGPDNGLFEVVSARASRHNWWTLPYPESRPSATFHGRDWFAPYAALLASGRWTPSGEGAQVPPSGGHALADACAEVIYIDHYGNVVTGLPGTALVPDRTLELGGHQLVRAETFSAVSAGELFWYVNANGLVEAAANRARACDRLGAYIGMRVSVR